MLAVIIRCLRLQIHTASSQTSQSQGNCLHGTQTNRSYDVTWLNKPAVLNAGPHVPLMCLPPPVGLRQFREQHFRFVCLRPQSIIFSSSYCLLARDPTRSRQVTYSDRLPSLPSVAMCKYLYKRSKPNVHICSC